MEALLPPAITPAVMRCPGKLVWSARIVVLIASIASNDEWTKC